MPKIYFHNNLKALRKSKGWTQESMQEQLKIPRSTWANYESGISEPDIRTLVRIAKIFDLVVDDLLLKDLSSLLPNTKKLKEYEEDFPQSLVEEEEIEPAAEVLQQLQRMEEKIDRLLDKKE